MLTLLVIVPLLAAIGLVGGLSRSIRGTLGTLMLVGLVFAVPAGAGEGPSMCGTAGCGEAWVGPTLLTAAIILPYLLGLVIRHRLEHTSAPEYRAHISG